MKNSNKWITVICETCGQEFEALKYKERKFCCKDCYNEWRKQNQIKAKKTKSCVCKVCDEIYFTYASKPKNLKLMYSTIFCSKECKDEYLKLKVIKNNLTLYDIYKSRLSPNINTRRSPKNKMLLEVECNYCGKWYNPKCQDVEDVIATGGYFYCKDDCKKLNLVPTKISSTFRKLIFKRDHYRCTICKTTRNLQPYYIQSFGSEDIINSYTTLCTAHHMWAYTQAGYKYYQSRYKKNH